MQRRGKNCIAVTASVATVLWRCNGENAQWIDPKPRDFTAATFKCRSTPTGTLPTDQDLYNSVVVVHQLQHAPLGCPDRSDRIDLVAYIKTFSPRWTTEKPGAPINIPAEPAVTMAEHHPRAELFQRWNAGSAWSEGAGRPSTATLTTVKTTHPSLQLRSGGDDSRFKCGVTNQDVYRIFHDRS